jgi:hypothetical protein
MKFSDAIRLGAMMKPQGTWYLLLDGRTCAIGAAADAVGIQLPKALEGVYSITAEELALAEVRARWPEIAATGEYKCPLCQASYWSIEDGVIHLNDLHCLGREHIADWVDTLVIESVSQQPESSDVVLV